MYTGIYLITKGIMACVGGGGNRNTDFKAMRFLVINLSLAWPRTMQLTSSYTYLMHQVSA